MIKIRFIITLKVFFFIINFVHAQRMDQLDPNMLRQLNTLGFSQSQINLLLSNSEMQSQLSRSSGKNLVDSLAASENTVVILDSIESTDKSVNLISEEIENVSEKTLDSLNEDSEIENLASDFYPYFGYNVFSSDPEFFQKSNSENIDPNYLIGPGDDIIIMLWGETEFNKNYIVSRDGYIFIDNIGQVFVNGLKLIDLESKIKKLLVRVYSSLDDSRGPASTFIDISIGSLSLRPLRIFALGEVSQPGAYTVKNSTSIFSSLYYFNGPTTNGSLRDIHLIRNKERVASIDFYDFLVSGNKVNDIRLQRDDIVFFPPRKKTILVKGEITRPAIYELKSKEGLRELIEIAGGITAKTFMDRLQIERILPAVDRVGKNNSKILIDLDLNEYIASKQNFELLDEDVITFFSISDDISNVIKLRGAVHRPGKYAWTADLTLEDIVHKAGGFLGDTFLEKVDIERTNDNYSLSFLSINLVEEPDNLKNKNLLKPLDVITFYKLSDLVYKTDISISGHVKSPLSMKYMSNITLYDLIFRAGGFNDENHLQNTYMKKAELFRWNADIRKRETVAFNLDSVLNKTGLHNLHIEMGDSVHIYSKSDIEGDQFNSVKVSGFAKRPTSYPYYKGMNVKDVLFASGVIGDLQHSNLVFLERVDIFRYSEDKNSRNILNIDLNDILKENNSDANLLLEPGDEIRLYSKEMFESEKIVFIRGQVENPGQYELKENMSLKDLILIAGGISDDVFQYRAEIASIETDPKELGQASSITVSEHFFNEMSYYTSNKKPKILLKPYDLVTIRPNPNYSRQKSVTILGKIYYPGNYVLKSSNEMLTELIDRSGGLTEDAYPEASKLIRSGKEISLSFKEMIKRPKSKLNFKLMPGDTIKISAKSNIISIFGAINAPGDYQFVPGFDINDYIKMAGGFSEDAAKNNVYIKYPNGRSKKNSFFNSPKVLDSSVITIKSKQDVVPFNLTEYISSLTQIYADLSQIYLLVVLARS